MLIRRMCSAKGDARGPSRRSGHNDGGYSRSPFHLVAPGAVRALCGVYTAEWLEIDKTELHIAAANSDCCARCARASKLAA